MSFPAVEAKGQNAMFARVTRFQVSPEKGETFPDVSLLGPPPALQEQTGFKGLMTFVNRENGMTMLITLWERRNALEASSGLAVDLANKVTGDVEAQVLGSMEVYEVFTSARIE